MGATLKPVGPGLAPHPVAAWSGCAGRVSSAAVAVGAGSCCWTRHAMGGAFPGAGASGAGDRSSGQGGRSLGGGLLAAPGCEVRSRPGSRGSSAPGPGTYCPRPGPGGAAITPGAALGPGAPGLAAHCPPGRSQIGGTWPKWAGVALGGRAGKSGGPGSWSAEGPQGAHPAAACLDVLGRGTRRQGGGWGGKVEGCGCPRAGHPLQGPRGHFQAPGPGTAGPP